MVAGADHLDTDSGGSLFNGLLHKFYAASISIDPAGAMLVTSTRDRIMAWGMLFCLIAFVCLVCLLVWRRTAIGKLSMLAFVVSLWIPVLVIPSIKHEYIQVSEWQMTIDNGSWLPDSRRVIDLNNLHKITERQNSILPGNLMGDPDVVWQISWNDGKREDLELNTFFNAHRMVVAYFIRDHGHAMSRLEDPNFSFKATSY